MRFTETDIEVLLNNPGEVSDRPYLLFTSYALNAIRNLVITDDDEEDQEMWGRRWTRTCLTSSSQNWLRIS